MYMNDYVQMSKDFISIEKLGIVILALILVFFILRSVKRLLSKRRKIFLSGKSKSKAERKYRKLLAQFNRKHKRKPSKDDLFKIVITASHHTFPVKGKNSRNWMRGRKGHWKRQKVRKYLLEKHNIVENFRMK